MATSRRHPQRLLGALAVLAAAASLQPAVFAEPPQALAILLRQLQARPLGLYDGMRLFRLAQPGGGSLTLSVSCEREEWRVANSDTPQGPSFTAMPFLSARGIARTWVCTGPARALE